jgi:hypothetical protein
MSAKSPAQSVLIILFGIFAFLIVIIPLFDAYILSNIAKDIASPTGTQYLAYVPIAGFILLLFILVLLIVVSKKAPPIVINIKHRKRHPNTTDTFGGYFELRDTSAKKYHDQLLHDTKSSIKGEERQ